MNTCSQFLLIPGRSNRHHCCVTTAKHETFLGQTCFGLVIDLVWSVGTPLITKHFTNYWRLEPLLLRFSDGHKMHLGKLRWFVSSHARYCNIEPGVRFKAQGGRKKKQDFWETGAEIVKRVPLSSFHFISIVLSWAHFFISFWESTSSIVFVFAYGVHSGMTWFEC